MANEKIETNVSIINTQERWQELALNIDSHAALLVQLSDIAEKFQAVDTVFSDFKKTQQTLLSLEEQITQQRESIQVLQKIVEEFENRDTMSDSLLESLKSEWNIALQQAASETKNSLQSTDNDLKETRKILQLIQNDLTTKLQQCSEKMADLQEKITALQQNMLVDSRTSSSLMTELTTLRQTVVQNSSELQSLRDNMNSLKSTRAHIYKLRNLTTIAIVLGCLALGLSVILLSR